MAKNKFGIFLGGILGATLSTAIHSSSANAANLSLGADYLLRGVSVNERDVTIENNDYYDQRLQAYLITDLSKDVEATVRIQSISAWGAEGNSSTSTLSTRYPDGNGDLWVQNAFVRLPGLWEERIILTLGRQGMAWGDGAILSDDELGFNALRAQIKSPFRFLPIDLDVFTAKINETFRTNDDTDLSGAVIGFNRESVRWEIMGLVEDNGQTQNYDMGATSEPFTVSSIKRNIFGVRFKTMLRDAYVKGEYYLQQGEVGLPGGATDLDLTGDAWLIGLGARSNVTKFGRFGAVLEVANGSGDDPETPLEDEAFRAPFAARWDGLERKGYGRYFGATFSDAYSPSDPFGPATSTNDGLPPGTSGIQTIKFGVDSSPWAKWTFSFDYFQYKAQKNLLGPKDLGTEFDYGIEYRYSGLVTFRADFAQFRSGDAFTTTPVNTRSDASLGSAEVELHF